MAKRETAKKFIKKKDAEFKKKKAEQVPTEFKDVNRRTTHPFLLVDWMFMQQSNIPNRKVFVIERFQRKRTSSKSSYKKGAFKKGDIEYRIGYYIIGKNGNKKDKWTWGQFCPLIPIEDLVPLLKQAKEKGVIINSEIHFE